LVLGDGKIAAMGSPAEIFAGHQVSGKFKFPGTVIGISQDQGINIVTILVGNNAVKVVATDEEIKGLSIGSKIIVASKAFNPMIIK
jgi:molybdate transport system ATP-binding protein